VLCTLSVVTQRQNRGAVATGRSRMSLKHLFHQDLVHLPLQIVLNAFKANATRKMRESGCWQSGKTPWVKKGSKRRLWKEKDLIAAIVYVESDQGEPLP